MGLFLISLVSRKHVKASLFASYVIRNASSSDIHTVFCMNLSVYVVRIIFLVQHLAGECVMVLCFKISFDHFNMLMSICL